MEAEERWGTVLREGIEEREESAAVELAVEGSGMEGGSGIVAEEEVNINKRDGKGEVKNVEELRREREIE